MSRRRNKFASVSSDGENSYERNIQSVDGPPNRQGRKSRGSMVSLTRDNRRLQLHVSSLADRAWKRNRDGQQHHGFRDNFSHRHHRRTDRGSRGNLSFASSLPFTQGGQQGICLVDGNFRSAGVRPHTLP